MRGIERVRIGRGPARAVRRDEPGVLELQVPDSWMSARHAELSAAGDRWRLVDLGSKNGVQVRGARTKEALVGDGELFQLGRTFLALRARRPAPDAGGAPLGLATLSPAFAAVRERAAAVASSAVPVLLLGETGTGKEVLARAIHRASGRSGPFVAVNCGALPSELVESELFGHKKGSFSGAVGDREGLIRASDRGTLFLDEIGDLPLPAQAALLRVLQQREVTPVGGTRPTPVDLRVLAATHRDLDAMVAAATFRDDLHARLDGVTLELPPLRDRRDDVPLLVAELLGRLAPGRRPLGLLPEAATALLEHDWPRNVRELEQALAGALALCQEGPIERAHLPRSLTAARAAPRPLGETPDRDQLLALLDEHAGNLAAIARAVGKHRTQVVRWVVRHGLDPDKHRRD